MAQPLLRDALSWYEHSSISYVRQALPAAPQGNNVPGGPNPGQGYSLWTLLPYENNVIGERLVTRQEIDLPFQAGPVKLVPYALGELGHWGQDVGDPFTGAAPSSIDRAYGQVGIRSSLPMWTSDNSVESRLWNLHGLAHKVIFEAEFSYADATKDVNQFPLYDQLDDDTINQYRRNIAFLIFKIRHHQEYHRTLTMPYRHLISQVQEEVLIMVDMIRVHMQFVVELVAG